MLQLNDQWTMLSLVSLFVDVGVLAALYAVLPGTAKTGHLRFMMRFAVIWALGDIGVRYAISEEQGQGLLRGVSEIVLLLGMVPMSALWTHMAWLTSSDLKGIPGRKALDSYQLGVYVVAIVIIWVGPVFRNGLDLLAHPYTVVFQVWFLACLMYAVWRFLGAGYENAPAIEKRSRQVMSAAAGAMFMLVLIDVLQYISGGEITDLMTGFGFVPLLMLGVGFLMKRKFIVALPARDRKGGAGWEARSSKGSRAIGGGYHLAPGRIYVELDDPKGKAVDVLRAQVRRGRTVLLVTSRDPEDYRNHPKLGKVPVVRYITEEWDDPSGIDTTSPDELAMVPWMASEYALEAWEQDKDPVKDTGCAVVIDAVDALARVVGKDGTKTFLAGLGKAIDGQGQLRAVLIGDRKGLGRSARMFDKAGKPLKAI